MTDMRIGPAGHALFARRDGGSEKPAILFLNSLAADLSMWDDVIPKIGDDFAALRMDARGHGKSDVGRGPFTLELLGRDALSVLDGFGIERAAVCGLSLGGLVGQWLAVNHPRRVSHLILANTAANFPPASMWRERMAVVGRQGMEPIVQPTLDRWLTHGFRASQPARTAKIGAMIAATDPAGYAACAGVLADADMLSLLPNVAAPTLVIVGDEDPSTSPERGRELAAAIPGAHLTSLAAAHLSAVEQPASFAVELGRFLRSAPPAREH